MPVRLKKSRVPNLYRAENGNYYMRVMVSGKAVMRLLRTVGDQKPVKSFDLAKIILNNELSAMGSVNSSSPLSWERVCDDYLKKYSERPDLTEKTIHDKRYEVEFARKAFPNMQVPDITGAHLDKWWCKFCREKRENGEERSARTKNKVLDTMKSIFRFAESSGFIASSPKGSVKHLHVSKTFKQVFTVEQFRAVVLSMRDAHKRLMNIQEEEFDCHSSDMVEFLAYSGARIAEARLLRREDIQRDGVVIHGVKRGDDRFVEYNRKLREVCARLVKFHEEMLRKPNERIFLIHSPRKAFERAVERIHAPHCTMHGLRHFFITSCVENGVTHAVIARWVGHKDTKLIDQTYTHIRNEHSRAEADKLNF